jgi:hypothetical protein
MSEAINVTSKLQSRCSTPAMTCQACGLCLNSDNHRSASRLLLSSVPYIAAPAEIKVSSILTDDAFISCTFVRAGPHSHRSRSRSEDRHDAPMDRGVRTYNSILLEMFPPSSIWHSLPGPWHGEITPGGCAAVHCPCFLWPREIPLSSAMGRGMQPRGPVRRKQNEDR